MEPERGRRDGGQAPDPAGGVPETATAAAGETGTPRAAAAATPESPAEESGPPPTELEVLQAAHAELQDRYLRLAAEFDNFRKRTAREWRELKDRAAAEVLREMLELADNLERALAAPDDDPEGLRKGVRLIAQQLQAALKRFGVEPIEAAGQEFDPTRHEAVLAVDSDTVESQRIVDVVRRGYVLNGEVLRPARVTVAR